MIETLEDERAVRKIPKEAKIRQTLTKINDMEEGKQRTHQRQSENQSASAFSQLVLQQSYKQAPLVVKLIEITCWR